MPWIVYNILCPRYTSVCIIIVIKSGMIMERNPKDNTRYPFTLSRTHVGNIIHHDTMTAVWPAWYHSYIFHGILMTSGQLWRRCTSGLVKNSMALDINKHVMRYAADKSRKKMSIICLKFHFFHFSTRGFKHNDIIVRLLFMNDEVFQGNTFFPCLFNVHVDHFFTLCELSFVNAKLG